MRIAQIAPLYEAVPPKLYGGTERVVSYLTEALVDLGHDVTLFASGDSVTSANLDACWPRALRLDPTIRDALAPHVLMMEKVRKVAHEFDVLHFHLDYMPFPLFTTMDTPFVTTLHGRLDLPELQPVFDAFSNVPVVSISDSQRAAAAASELAQHDLPRSAGAAADAANAQEAGISGVPRPYLSRKARRYSYQDRCTKRFAAEDRRQGGQGRPGILQARNRAAAVAGACGVRRRDQRGAEARVSFRRQGAAVPDRLVGAVRPRDDRSRWRAARR